MYLVIDTETSGLCDFRAPADAPGQPRLASIALLYCDEDLQLTRSLSTLIAPADWVMTPDAERVNGLSQAFLTRHGHPITSLLDIYNGALRDGYTVVAHNVQYDTKVMRGELRRAGMPDLYGKTPCICTMSALTDICAIPSSRGRGFKWPKLSEAVAHCFGREHANAHGCLPDAMAALDLARWLKERDWLPCATVGRAA